MNFCGADNIGIIFAGLVRVKNEKNKNNIYREGVQPGVAAKGPPVVLPGLSLGGSLVQEGGASSVLRWWRAWKSFMNAASLSTPARGGPLSLGAPIATATAPRWAPSSAMPARCASATNFRSRSLRASMNGTFMADLAAGSSTVHA